jgi:hypothetical protein
MSQRTPASHEGIVPIVNNICLPLPFFLPFPTGPVSSPASVFPPPLPLPLPLPFPPPGPHGFATGAGSPRMARKLWLPVA